MSWDTKSGHGPYYYRSVRDGERTRKVYVGRGARAQEAAQQAEDRRQACLAASQALALAKARTAGADEALLDFRSQVLALLRAALTVGGYHEHRGQYRRRRHDRHHGIAP